MLLVGRFARGSRKDWINRMEAVGAAVEKQISSETRWVVIGESRWPLRRNGYLPRDLLIAQALATHSGRPIILGETEFLSRLRGDQPFPGSTRSRERAVGDVASAVAGSVGDVLRQRNLVWLISTGVPIKRLRRALAQLCRWFPEAIAAGLALRDCTGVIGIRTSGGWMTPNGQRLIDFGDNDRDAQDRVPWSASVDSPVILALSDGMRTEGDAGADLFAMAIARERDGDLRQAESLYRQLLQREGPDADVCYNLANVLAATGQVGAALERLSQAVELRPRFAEAWYNQGVLAQRVGKSSLARDCCHAALRIAPDLAAAVASLTRTDPASGAGTS